MTVDDIRQDYLNGFLSRVDAETLPWTDAQCDAAIVQALDELWPDFGLFSSATVATDATSPIYTIPGTISRISRIVVERTDGGNVSHVGRVDNWRIHSDTEVVITPLIVTDATLVLRFYGWGPFANDATDLPTHLGSLVAMKAASLSYGQLLGRLGNNEDQLALDSGRIVTHQDAVAMSAYWQRRYDERARSETNRLSLAPRAASRG